MTGILLIQLGTPDAPTPEITPPVTATHPPASSRPAASQVATSFAFRTNRSAIVLLRSVGVGPVAGDHYLSPLAEHRDKTRRPAEFR